MELGGRVNDGRAQLLVLASGKGGSGVSTAATNLSVQLARGGLRTVLADCDFSGPGLELYLGVGYEAPGLADWRPGQRPDELLRGTPYPELSFLGRGVGEARALRYQRKRRLGLLAALGSLEADVVVVDAGSGRRVATLDCLQAADAVLLVVTPDPIAVRSTLELLLTAGAEDAEAVAPSGTRRGEPRGPAGDRWRAAGRLACLLNRSSETVDEDDDAAELDALSRALLGLPAPMLGALVEDDAVHDAARCAKPAVRRSPSSPYARCLDDVADRLASYGFPSSPHLPRFAECSHYQVLGLERTCRAGDVRRARERLLEVFAADNPTVRGLLSNGWLAEARERVDAAYRTLIYVESRADYDRETTEREERERDARVAAATGPAPESAPPSEPDVETDVAPGEDTFAAGLAELEDVEPSPWSGGRLRERRLQLGLTLDTISRETKIRVPHLRSIEADLAAEQLSPVFLKGFLRAYATCLGLEPERVCRDYLHDVAELVDGEERAGG